MFLLLANERVCLLESFVTFFTTLLIQDSCIKEAPLAVGVMAWLRVFLRRDAWKFEKYGVMAWKWSASVIVKSRFFRRDGVNFTVQRDRENHNHYVNWNLLHILANLEGLISKIFSVGPDYSGASTYSFIPALKERVQNFFLQGIYINLLFFESHITTIEFK